MDRNAALANWLDSNCSCNLKLGFSSGFGRMMKPSSNTTDPIDSIFRDPHEQNRLTKRTHGMEENYPGVKDGSKKSVTCYPAGFNFDSKIKKFNTVVIKQLDQIANNLKKQAPSKSIDADRIATNLQSLSVQKGVYVGKDVKVEINKYPGLSRAAKKQLGQNFNDQDTYDEKHIKDQINKVSYEIELAAIKDFLKTIKPQDSERIVYERLISLFANERGLIQHSMTTDVYLQVFVNEARQERKKNNLGMGLTTQEKKIAKALNLTSQDLDHLAKEIINDLQNDGLSSPYQLSDIERRIENKTEVHKDLKQKAKKHLKGISNIDDNIVFDALRLATYEYESKFPGELDLLGIFPDLQMVLHVEVKCKEIEKTKNDNNLTKASEQMSRYAKHLAKRHGSILSDKWNYCKVAAIVPGLKEPQNICSHCQNFVLTEKELNNDETMRSWWESFFHYKNNSQTSSVKDQCYQEFLMFFNRAVNLSSIGRKTNVFNAWEEVEGENRPPVVAGFTPSSGSSNSFHDILTRPHDANKAIYFTPEQMSLLSPSNFFRVFLLADFGAGMLSFL